MHAPILTWIVQGSRILPDGGTHALLATAWGGTEQIARQLFRRQQELMAQQQDAAVPFFEDSELTFKPVEDGELE